MQSYLEELNEAQREAVENFEGPSLVIAGAGSGKTRVLTYRITHLIKQGVKPYNILALTFTNKAAKEMKERIATIVGHDIARNLWMGTFHSIFAKILRIESKAIGYPSSFTIYDTADSKSLIKSIVKEMKLSDKEYKPNHVLSRISSAKNDLCTPRAYAKDQNRLMTDQASKKPLIYEIYARYMKHCFKSGVMDFDDLLLNTNILLRDHPQIAEKYQNLFKYILVDEYQDTNISQYIIIKKLAEKHHNVCVVGDDAQSIYSFRGAKIENILNFRNDYKNYKLFKLEENYRSTQTIVNAANSIIGKNSKQIKKEVYSQKAIGDKIKLKKCYSDTEESFIVANDIANKHLTQHTDFKDIAILYRTNAQSRLFEEALRKNSLPYKIYGGLSFYQRKEIKDLLAYFRLTVNTSDNEAFKRIINYPARGIGKTTLDKIASASTSSGYSMWQIITSPGALNVNAGTQKKLNSFAGLVAGFYSRMEQMDAYDFAMEVATQSGILKELYADRTPESQVRQENTQELLNAVKEFSDSRKESGESSNLVDFLQEVSLLTDQDGDKSDDINKVTMMTIHASKGLEFKHVYIVGVEEGLFPSTMTIDSEQGIEEERRLFYVAVTRAEEEVSISFARSRYKFGEISQQKPSRFIYDIDTQYLDLKLDDKFSKPNSQTLNPASSFRKHSTEPNKKVNFNFTAKEQTSASPKSNFNFKNTTQGSLAIGMQVEHERFGIGEILAIEGNPPNEKATVLFKNAGQKQLLLKFAKLKILS